MKKIFILIILLLIVFMNSMSKKVEFSFDDYFSEGVITKYTNANNDNIKLFGKVSINNINNNYSIVGEKILLHNSNISASLKNLKAKILLSEYLQDEDIYIYYCYTPFIPKSVSCKGKTINLQIVSYPQYTILGWPLILGSY